MSLQATGVDSGVPSMVRCYFALPPHVVVAKVTALDGCPGVRSIRHVARKDRFGCHSLNFPPRSSHPYFIRQDS